MQYMVKGDDNEEYGPVDQAELIHWAKEGNIQFDTEIKNSLSPIWRKATDFSFLDEHLQEESKKLAKDAERKADEMERESLTTFNYTPGSFKYRLMAGFLDQCFISVLWFVPVALAFFGLSKEFIHSPLFTSLAIGGYALVFLLYYTYFLGMKAQTFGMHLFGLLIVKGHNGKDVYADQAFLYSVLLLFLFPLTPYALFIVPSKRTLPGVLSNCRIIFIKRKK